ncbi:MAG: beta-ketoacyl synthase N-terminal-like domain-containing protein [Phycisphaeraceae bacterium]
MPEVSSHEPARRLIIAGVGLISPLGFGAWATFRSLLNGRSIADRAPGIEPGTDPVALIRGVGGVAVARHARDDPAAELAERAAREACEQAGVDLHGMPTRLGTSKGAVAAISRAFAERRRVNVAALSTALGPQGFLSHRLSVRTGCRVEGHHVGACASSLIALDAAARELRTHNAQAPEQAGGHGDCRLVVTAEAALLPVFVHSYKRLGVLADTTPTGYRQAPLDASRKGFMLAELAAAVLLRALPAGEAPAAGDIELIDTAIAGEAFDMVRPSPTMEAISFVADRLLHAPGTPERGIDLLHPHAPGTRDHDPVELRALADVLNARREMTHEHAPIDTYANKGSLGHGLGAAGLVSLVLACLCAQARRRPPMPWLTEPMTPSPLPLQRDEQSLPADSTHAVFAAGFGGPTAGALIRRHA